MFTLKFFPDKRHILITSVGTDNREVDHQHFPSHETCEARYRQSLSTQASVKRLKQYPHKWNSVKKKEKKKYQDITQVGKVFFFTRTEVNVPTSYQNKTASKVEVVMSSQPGPCLTPPPPQVGDVQTFWQSSAVISLICGLLYSMCVNIGPSVCLVTVSWEQWCHVYVTISNNI